MHGSTAGSTTRRHQRWYGLEGPEHRRHARHDRPRGSPRGTPSRRWGVLWMARSSRGCRDLLARDTYGKTRRSDADLHRRRAHRRRQRTGRERDLWLPRMAAEASTVTAIDFSSRSRTVKRSSFAGSQRTDDRRCFARFAKSDSLVTTAVNGDLVAWAIRFTRLGDHIRRPRPDRPTAQTHRAAIKTREILPDRVVVRRNHARDHRPDSRAPAVRDSRRRGGCADAERP